MLHDLIIVSWHSELSHLSHTAFWAPPGTCRWGCWRRSGWFPGTGRCWCWPPTNQRAPVGAAASPGSAGTRKSKAIQGEVKLNCNDASKSLDKLEAISTIQRCLVNWKDLMEYESMQICLYKSKSSNVGKHTLTEKDQSVQGQKSNGCRTVNAFFCILASPHTTWKTF